jgi:GNAT superfamily N-acetyltransferase
MDTAAPWKLRVASPRDAEQVASVLEEGFESYRSFAPAGWEPPAPNWELDRLRERLADPEVWCLLAEREGRSVGHVSLLPAAKHLRWPSPEPGLVQLWHLFVRTDWWGSGLAPALHAEVLREAAARGYREMRLFTPTAQARARRFYEREGWKPVGGPLDAPSFGMPLTELRRAISMSV